MVRRELEDQLGLAKGTLTNRIRGRRKLEVGELFALLDAFGVPAGTFFAEVAAWLSSGAESEAPLGLRFPLDPLETILAG